MKKIAVFTSGGDSPGMNACIRAVVRTSLFHHCQAYGILHGYEGMLAGEIIPMDSQSVANIIQNGGTILKSSRSEEFRTVAGRKKAAEQLRKRGIDGLVCIGGNGSYAGALALSREHGIPCIGAPGTIDNDLYGTDFTIGFDTAVNTALDAIDRIRDTADSHNRTFFVEVMGRDSGFIALQVGLAGGAEAVFVPEISNQKNWIDEYFSAKKRKKSFSIIVVAEGEEEGGALVLAKKVQEKYPEIAPRVSILGHIQRGGRPTASDRILATRIGCAAVEALIAGKTDLACGVVNNEICFTHFEEAITKRKELSGSLYQLTRILNV